MPDNDRDYHARDPHFDGRYEGVINDDVAGNKIGIRSDVNPENMVQPKNPFNMKPKVDKEMKKFQDMFEEK
ncbi:hypothetical protein DZB84_03045 [Bacillus sp. HNG]|uniref:hypothetical protein n=1 Tax=Bacillus sp. HNG TaxID=2293325 RepID=UPI000E2FEEE7|nr:hypothetical protein [Bacillus sp. HNG]RFB19247.1 hypothetical protein DZB84_03045 [Bacillus sp. HNG]